MEAIKPLPNKLARTSLILGIVGWILYLLQWCFDFTLGLVLAAFTAGSSAICSSVMDALPFVVWVAGIVTGHAALSQIKRKAVPGRRQAIWGLWFSYIGMAFTILFVVIIVALIAAGIGVGVLGRIIPGLPKH